jgi:hypothetical protein
MNTPCRPFRDNTSMGISHIRGERIEEFSRLYAEDFRDEICKQEASVMALRLIELSC